MGVLHTYKETISSLLKYQSNASVLKTSVYLTPLDLRKKLAKIVENLESLQIPINDLNRLNVIHIAGTKGKGSTCSYVESILRHKGYKTGLYTSPHLLTVRERIKINGVNISEEDFIRYYWTIHDKLSATSPANFFTFMTIMAFFVFVQEHVDALILETGIGGEFDSTNVVVKPVVVGLTSLGMDHVDLLGNSIVSIAWHKAGILKPGSQVITVPQCSVAMEVIKQRSKEKNCSLELSQSANLLKSIKLGIEGDVQKINAGLAIDLCRCWESKVLSQTRISGPIDDIEEIALEKTYWPGRCHTICRGSKKFYLDGAHTAESMANCIKWFNTKIDRNMSFGHPKVKILIYTSTGKRSFEPLLDMLAKENFDFAIFVPPITDLSGTYSEMPDWRDKDASKMEYINKMQQFWINNCHKNEQTSSSIQCKCILEALDILKCPEKFPLQLPSNSDEMNILVTGSLLLVGGIMKIFESQIE